MPRERDVPVLLSVGYSACHWCHVMAHESFEDPVTAAQMNEGFVAVKVDREERPDVDAIYMEAVQAMSGRGGWPMTVFLTPDGRPFFAGTYFPDREVHGMPSFRRILAAITEAWASRRDEIEKQADELSESVRQRASLTDHLLSGKRSAGPDNVTADLTAGIDWERESQELIDKAVAEIRRSRPSSRRDGRRTEVSPDLTSRALPPPPPVHRRCALTGCGHRHSRRNGRGWHLRPPGRWVRRAIRRTRRGRSLISRRCSTIRRAWWSLICTPGRSRRIPISSRW